MFDVLVYLYETYHESEACPEPDVLVKKLTAIGFEDEEISRALDWLLDLAEANNRLLSDSSELDSAVTGFRIFAQREWDILSGPVIGFLQFLESAKVLSALQREVVIERAMAASEGQISLDKFKVIVLMVLWSQGKEPDSLIIDEFFLDSEDSEPRLLH